MNEFLISRPTIGHVAPRFKAKSTKGVIRFPEDYKGKWVILFSHPADFTPVCTTELIMFMKDYHKFKALNTELIALSIDSLYKHQMWTEDIEAMLKEEEQSEVSMAFPLIADEDLTIAELYGNLHPNVSYTETIRGVYIIDPEGVIQLITYYPPNLGRNTNELLRVIKGLQRIDTHGVAIPANWQEGEDVIDMPINDYKEEADERLKQDKTLKKCLDWYLCLKEDEK